MNAKRASNYFLLVICNFVYKVIFFNIKQKYRNVMKQMSAVQTHWTGRCLSRCMKGSERKTGEYFFEEIAWRDTPYFSDADKEGADARRDNGQI
jgi:5-hydroxyisourate hydrolase-like protein (transthyretin family)